jgi:hypothetical protein
MAYQSHTSPRPAHADYARADRQPYHKPHSSIGAAGHWIKTAGILAPLVIGEFVKDADQRWRYIRLASVATALISEGLWTNKIHNERKAAQERERECAELG